MVFIYYYLIVCCLSLLIMFIFFFFKQKTAYEMRISDWSSDVCSSDLSTPIHPHRITESSGESPTNMRGNARMIIICSNLITSATSRTSARSLLSDWRRHAGADDHRCRGRCMDI